MSYIINNSRGQIVAVVADGTVNTTATDLSLVGRGLTDYGTFENENYVFLLENFASPSAPARPVLGQLWYNSGTDTLSSYTSAGTWAALATQSFVEAQKNNTVLTGIPTAPTAAPGTNNDQLATTAFVTTGPQFAGIPTAPTAAPTANNDQLATTGFVQAQKNNTVLVGIPTAPTAAPGTDTTQLATTAFVQLEKESPAFTGTPTVPTAALGTANTQIASTAFVRNTLLINDVLGTVAYQNANSVSISGGSITGISPLSVTDGGTGSNTASQARTNLGLGSIATQNANSVGITGGTITSTDITGGTVSNLVSPVPVDSGGTGGNTAAAARAGIGLGSIATQNANSVSISGGSITGISPLSVTDGGTGASDAIAARTNLGLGSIATQNANSVGITGGTILGITSLGASSVNITSGSITGIIPLSVTDGGTGGNTAAAARAGIGAASSATAINTVGGIVGGGDLTASRTLSIASNSNGFGIRYVSTSLPVGGNNGDIWYQI